MKETITVTVTKTTQVITSITRENDENSRRKKFIDAIRKKRSAGVLKNGFDNERLEKVRDYFISRFKKNNYHCLSGWELKGLSDREKRCKIPNLVGIPGFNSRYIIRL